MSPWRRRAKGAFRQMSLSATGIGVALFPVLALAVLARVFDEDVLGALTVSMALGTFAGQVATAGIVEARLASHKFDPPHARMPYWLATLGIVAALIIAFVPWPVWVLVAFPPLLAALLVSRTVAIVEGMQGRETVAAGAVFAGSLSAVLVAGNDPRLAMALLGLGALVAIASRLPWRARRLPLPERHALIWVTLDAATTGLSQPYLNALLLTSLGPAAAVSFRSVNSVSAGVEPIIGVARLRLLRAHSRVEYFTSVALVLVAAVAVIILELVGFFDLLLGPAWADVTVLMLVIALASRLAALVSTPFFAILRRAGEVRRLYWIRLTTTALFLAFGSAGALLGSVTGALAGMLAAELTSVAIYWWAARRVPKASTETLSTPS